LFEGLLLNLAVLIVSLLVLMRASHLTITNAVKTSDASGLGTTTIGFLVVAFATSLPELLVSIFAALGAGTIGVAVGNVLGSQIVNVCFILGICILLVTRGHTSSANASLNGRMTSNEGENLYFGLFTASVIPLALIYIREASQIVGVALIAIFAYNTYHLVRANAPAHDNRRLTSRPSQTKRYVLCTLLGIVGVVSSAYFLIDSASYIALFLGVPGVVIGSTIVAFGTSIPELATSIDATRQGYLNMAFGNIIGSGFVNLTLILGVTLISSPFTLNILAFHDLAIFSLIANVFLWYFMSSAKITRREGLVLITLYAAFLASTFGGYRTV
jgi:cation:H+ antiporter